MTAEKASFYYEDASFGRIAVSENSRSKRISLRVAPGGDMRITCPVGTSPKEIALFLYQYRDKIDKLRTKQSKKKPTPKADLSDGASFTTHDHVVSISATATDNKLHLTLEKEEATLTYPPSLDSDPETRRVYIKKLLDKLLAFEAQAYLPKRVRELAQANNLTYDHVDLRNMKSKWGSCSSKGRICLNTQLMRLPQHLIDMVILHELNHTVHMDHSKAFWQDLDKLCHGNIKQLDEQIKAFSTDY